MKPLFFTGLALISVLLFSCKKEDDTASLCCGIAAPVPLRQAFYAGYVIDSSSGPVAGAHVVVDASEARNGCISTTNAAGRFMGVDQWGDSHGGLNESPPHDTTNYTIYVTSGSKTGIAHFSAMGLRVNDTLLLAPVYIH